MSDSPNRSEPENPIDPTTRGLIARKSWQLIRQTGLPRTDREDVEQMLTLQMLRRLPAPDADGNRRPGFVARALRQATINVLNYLTAHKRGVRPVALGALLGAEHDPPGRADREDAPSAAELSDLALDLAGALEALPADLRTIADQLREHSIAEVARTFGIPRSTLYERAKEIRAVFERHALDDYL